MPQSVVTINGTDYEVDKFTPPVFHSTAPDQPSELLASTDAAMLRQLSRWTRSREIGVPRYTFDVVLDVWGRKKLRINVTVPVEFAAQKLEPEDLARFLSGNSPYFVWAGKRVDNLSAYSADVLSTTLSVHVSLPDIRKHGMDKLEEVITTFKNHVLMPNNSK